MVDAKTAYLQRHCVPELIDGLINRLVDEEPPDPKAFLAECLRDGASDFANLPQSRVAEFASVYGDGVGATVRVTVPTEHVDAFRERLPSLLGQLRASQSVHACDAHRDALRDNIFFLVFRVEDAGTWKELTDESPLAAIAAEFKATLEPAVYRLSSA
eukprot:TRINITY_DN60008_c0_g1_i1.p2 TRINITY_DN60008_c0_g1~~TRINITY_DN60008_c0_g1_i1.p2  ORF type:complete len:158 (+),score=47.11 TRINITY_DN60008_c0_g1_i1:75-548(+)